MKQLEAEGIRSSAITLSPGPMRDELEQSGHDVAAGLTDGVPPTLAGGLPRKALNAIRMVRGESRMAPLVASSAIAQEADLIHVRWPQLVGLAGAAARRASIRAVWQMPNAVGSTMPFDLNRRYLRWLCRRYEVLPIANSRYTATTLAGGHSVPPHAHLGIDPAEFDPARHSAVARADLGVPEDAVLLGVLARLQPSKGQAELIEALALLGEQGSDVHLMIVGGPYPRAIGFGERLVELARSLSVDRRVHFVGRVEEPQRYLLAADVVVSSTVGAEPFGLSVIEAMMMGRPVLAHALGGPGETVANGRTGWLVDSAAPEDLARGIQGALRDRSRWGEMGFAARSHAIQEFSIAAAVQRYLRVVRENGEWTGQSGW
jgi:glycosyltransferase involved in cell wall biosynthesis